MSNNEMMSENTSSLIFAKVCSMFVLPVGSIIFGLVPIKLGGFSAKNVTKKQMLFDRIMSFALHFGAGVLLCTIFLHLLPDMRDNMSTLQKANLLPASSLSYPELILCIGFFMIYSIEQFVHSCLQNRSSQSKTNLKYNESRTPKSVFTLEKNLICPANDSSNSTNVVDCTEYNHIQNKCEHRNYHACENRHCYAADHNSDNDDDDFCDHDHIPDFSKSIVNSLLTVVALSVHESFEGMTVGLQKQTEMVYYMLGAISCHKLVLSAFIGVQAVSSKVNPCVMYAYIIVYSLTSSLGILTGMIVSMNSANSDSVNLYGLILQGLASGTLLYVVFFEIFMKNVGVHKLPGSLKTVASIIGFVSMTFLQTELTPGK